MIDGYSVNAITPAGRKAHLEILSTYILRDRDIIDRWTLWVNTPRERDIAYCHELKDQYPDFIELVFHEELIERISSQSPFFEKTIDPKTLYIKFDDDIVFVDRDAVKNLAKFRIENPEPFLVMANTVCNGICSYIHQRYGSQDFYIDGKYERIPPEFANKIWSCVRHAEYVHRTFLKDLMNEDTEKYKFSSWELSQYQRFAINCFSWLGKDFAEFAGGIPHYDEEDWLTTKKCKELKRPNVICGTALVSHYAFHKHRKPFCVGREIDPRLLKAYRMIAQNADHKAIHRILDARSTL